MSIYTKTPPMDVMNLVRKLMSEERRVNKKIDAYLVSWGDGHQSAYTLGPRDQRLAVLTGFTGEDGIAILTEKTCALWTDAAYFAQAEFELDPKHVTLMKDGTYNAKAQCEWMVANLPVGAKVGADPLFTTFRVWSALSKAMSVKGLELIAMDHNLVDEVWVDKPQVSKSPVYVHPLQYAGQTWHNKVKVIRQKLKEQCVDALVLAALDEIAWLLNLRGADVRYTPVFYAYAVITHEDIFLFVDKDKIGSDVYEHLQMEKRKASDRTEVHVLSYDKFHEFLLELSQKVDSKIWIDNNANSKTVMTIPEQFRYKRLSPVVELKAVKNDAEVSGMWHANLKDAVAFCEFLHWLETEVPKGTVTEISAGEKLNEFRKEQGDLLGMSFQLLSCCGPNGAIVIEPTSKSNRRLSTTELYFLDSGAQFRDGTTDSTRTLHFGNPSTYERECFTNVLKGHINFCSMVFPNGIKGYQLDTITKHSLWENGLDFVLGNGHGVGSGLYVVELGYGPSGAPGPDDIPYQEGMVIANEPGYYENGNFGIRIENCLLVTKAETKHSYNNKDFLKFEVLSLIPFQRKMIATEMLDAKQIKWINRYHQQCRQTIGEELKRQGKNHVHKWLLEQTLIY